MAGPVLGHIDCPSCRTAKGMRITHDKNGDPFGYCEARCSQQLRIGGDKSRVRDFVALYPWAGPVTGTGPAPAPAPVSAPAPAPVAAPAEPPAAPPPKPKPTWASVLGVGG
jgi:hypothetical protein